jgi:hypothetical protein
VEPRRTALALSLALLSAAGTASAQSDTSSSSGAPPAGAASSSPAPAGGSSAAPSGDDAARLEEAREQYRQGVAAFRARHFGDAVVAFERSYRLRPHPTTLYNAAEARLRAGDRDQAVAQLREMLAMTSPAPDAQTVDRARALAHEAGVDDLQPAEHRDTSCPACPTCPPQRECPTATVPQRVTVNHGPLPFVFAAAGFVFFGVGLAFYGHALADSSAYNSPNNNDPTLQNSLRSVGVPFTWIGVAGIAIGLIAEAAAVFFYLHPPAASATARNRAPMRPTAHFDFGPTSVMLSGTF